ncbi:MAG: CoA pyrophosphatase [Spirochaetales bacterium]|nr:CoA pyrophosphatase [Spirochaetales bacterium]
MAAHQPRVLPGGGKLRAAVALVLCGQPGSGAETGTPAGAPATSSAAPAGAPRVLFIERTKHDGDPWSGHLAFPGGRLEERDLSLRDAAERETLEEIGLDLSSAEYLGRLDDVTGVTTPVVVSGFAYSIASPAVFALNHEVSDAFWVSLDDLLDVTRRTQYRFHSRGAERSAPAIDLLGPGRPLLWGLTYRFVAQFLRLLGYEVPAGY